jgi:hypothetical protein
MTMNSLLLGLLNVALFALPMISLSLFEKGLKRRKPSS